MYRKMGVVIAGSEFIGNSRIHSEQPAIAK